MNTKKPLVICTTLLIENSPQALPLGAACIASAIKKDARTKDKFSVELRTLSRKNPAIPKDSRKNLLPQKLPEMTHRITYASAFTFGTGMNLKKLRRF